ncbi:hypothetical protein SCALIN_C43_0051 [Candidatus Scalindua japonica]|uniref:Fido domain-containing protein n=1 Tax=Candidatus Scalindua japonica TaxID=1284222 RepID=A0A286U3U4_9BACT|nr:Fic family protein [Candidatus Scalindua japonica]GAX62795.1 hypothetical protein SCALIN_C43_0051 [Candidatus Scalindua japonica]
MQGKPFKYFLEAKNHHEAIGFLLEVITETITHYNFVRIHPFDDGNGRCARILMNLILMKKTYPPAVIKNEESQIYLETLGMADRGDMASFVEFVTKS